MRTLLAICIFAIGLMVTLPGTSSGSAPPPDPVSFVVGHFDFAPAMVSVQENTFVVYQSQLAPATVMVKEKGGSIIEKSITTYLVTFYNYKNAIVPTTDLALKSDYCRLCKPSLMANQRQSIGQRNMATVHPYPRDGLRQG